MIIQGIPIDADRFWSKVDKSGECWIWTGGKTSAGYGAFWAAGKVHLAHRISYEHANGPIPDGMIIDHRCHEPKCVNLAHIRLATQKQNCENLSDFRKNNTSGIRGVYWHTRDRRWVARVQHRGVRVRVGRFIALEDAEAAVIAKRNELFTHNDKDRKAA